VTVLRQNSRLRRVLGEYGVEFLKHAMGSFQRILPHVELSDWEQVNWRNTESVWVDNKRRKIRVTIAIGEFGNADAGALTATVSRRHVPVAVQAAGGTLDTREYDICKRISNRIAEIIAGSPAAVSGATMRAVRDSFDEDVVAQHLEEHHNLSLSMTTLFADLHVLSEQTYENKSVSFGCIIDADKRPRTRGRQFPREFLKSKKYRALSDGYRTAYYVSANGRVLDFVDLEATETRPLTAHSNFPDWAEPLARNSRGARYGIALSRQGDILVFDGGTLRFTYRHGKWQYWNHNHIVNLLADRAKAQRVSPQVIGALVGTVYVSALDVSFRRSGGLFVILHNRRNLRQIVKPGDAVGEARRTSVDKEFDELISGRRIQSLEPAVTMELAALDGAIVVSNRGEILAYGAVLSPKKAGRLRGTEGSRTKAAIGASNYGLAIKVSSDGNIDAYYRGKHFMQISGAT
jgi:hypothetical protein